jgi:glutathione S-transferase
LPSRPILYSFRRCPYAIRARTALAYAGIQVELREVLLREKPPCLLESSPKGTVPVLILPDGKVVDESLDVMRWALEQCDPDDWRITDDSARRRDADGLIDRIDAEFKTWLNAYKYPERHPELADRSPRERGLNILTDLNVRIERHRHLCGPSTSIADAAWYPFVRQFAHVDRDWFYCTDLSALQDWLRNWLDSRLFAAIMVKHQPWTDGDPAVLWP